MENATDVEKHTDIVDAYLCKDCKEVSLRMVEEYETSPLPQWDLSKCEFKRLRGETFEQLLQDSVMLVQAADEQHVSNAKADAAKIVTFAAARRGDIQGVEQLP